MIIKESNLKRIIRNKICEMLNESTQNLVDNFSTIANLINLTDSNDQFFFVQILKRWKDNKDKGMVRKTDGTYHGGAEYGNYDNDTAFKIRSAQELMALKPKITQICDSTNSRAYIVCNPRSDKEIQSFINSYKHRFRHGDPRIEHAEEILAGQAKGDGPMALSRPRFFFDIDTTDKRVWTVTKLILTNFNIPIEMEYVTPSEGLHVIIPDRNLKDMNKVIFYLRFFDGPLWKRIENNFTFDANGNVSSQDASHIVNIILSSASGSNASRNFPNLDRLQMVHANFDGKLILYSNVVTAGY